MIVCLLGNTCIFCLFLFSSCVLQLHGLAEETSSDLEAVHLPSHALRQLEQPGRDLPTGDVETSGTSEEQKTQRKRGGSGRHEAPHSDGQYFNRLNKNKFVCKSKRQSLRLTKKAFENNLVWDENILSILQLIGS